MRPSQAIQILFLSLLIALMAILSSCRGEGTIVNAVEIRNGVKEQFKSDTSILVRESLTELDTITLNSPERSRHMYAVLNKLAFNLYHGGDAAKSVNLSRYMLDELHNKRTLDISDKRELLNLYVILGTSFSESGMQSVSLDYYAKGLENCTDSADMEYKARFYNNIGVLYAQANMLDKAYDYFNKSLKINLRKNIHYEAYLNYANLAEIYAIKGDISKAQQATQKALDHLDTESFPLLLADMRVQQGELFTRQKQYDVALLRYNSALEQYKASNYISGAIETKILLSDLYLHRAIPDSALFYAQAAIDKAKSTNQAELIAKALSQLSAVKEVLGENGEAVKLLKESTAISDSLRTTETQLRLNNWEILQPEILPSSNAAKSTTSDVFKILFIVSCTGVIILIVYLIFYIRKSRLSKEKNNEILKSIEEENGTLTRELTSLSIEKVKLSEGVMSICDQLRSVLLELNPRETTKRENIRQLLAKLDHLSLKNSDEEFKHYFERIHPDFYKLLLERWPELTQRDLRLCAFIYLGLNTKEIASITYREVRSVESARNRLRKKLGIENSDDLQSFLQALWEGSGNSL